MQITTLTSHWYQVTTEGCILSLIDTGFSNTLIVTEWSLCYNGLSPKPAIPCNLINIKFQGCLVIDIFKVYGLAKPVQ